MSALRAPILDALLRLVRLLDTPQDIPVLAPLFMRELFRLLQGEQHGRLAEMAIGDGRLRRVAAAISWIEEHYAEPLQIEALARRANMSSSALHAHFKAVAYEVGYASASQFSREYGRLFGQPPRRDAERMRELTPLRP